MYAMRALLAWRTYDSETGSLWIESHIILDRISYKVYRKIKWDAK